MANKNETSEAIHTAVDDGNPNEGHAKDMGLVKPPIVSVNPTRADKKSEDWNKQKSKFMIVDNANQDVPVDDTRKRFYSEYPLNELEVGQGVFVPNEPGQSTDKAVEKMYGHIARARDFYSEVERDEHGDEILEQCIIRERKKNEDGTFQLSGDGKIITGANSVSRPKLVGGRHFIIRTVLKDGVLSGDGSKRKSNEDGIMVIRVV